MSLFPQNLFFLPFFLWSLMLGLFPNILWFLVVRLYYRWDTRKRTEPVHSGRAGWLWPPRRTTSPGGFTGQSPSWSPRSPNGTLPMSCPKGLPLDVSIVWGAGLGKKAGDLNICMSRFAYSLVFDMVPHPQLCLVPTSGDPPIRPLQRIGLGYLPGLEEARQMPGLGEVTRGAVPLKAYCKRCSSNPLF